MIASNLEVDGKKLCVELNNPFKMIYDLNESQEWVRVKELVRTI